MLLRETRRGLVFGLGLVVLTWSTAGAQPIEPAPSSEPDGGVVDADAGVDDAGEPPADGAPLDGDVPVTDEAPDVAPPPSDVADPDAGVAPDPDALDPDEGGYDVDVGDLDADSGIVVEDGWGEDPGDAAEDSAAHVRYFLEDVRIEGDTRTRPHLIRAFVPFERGEVIDPESDDLQAIAWAIRGTGWFSRVRIRLERGSERGWVDLVVEVTDRNSIVVNQFLLGISEGLSSSRDRNTDVLPYVGFAIADTNVLGSGNAVTLAGLMSQRQQAVRVGYQAPRLFRSPYTLRLATSYHNGREFYGHQPYVSTPCGADAPPDCSEEAAARNAVVFYRRVGVSAGIGRTVGASFLWSIDWVGDVLKVQSMPEAASEMRGSAVVPIDFHVAPGRSMVSSLRLTVGYDRRDDPNLTRRGILVRAQGEVGSRLFGSRYDYTRFQATVRGWVPLPHRQVLRLSFFGGIITGEAPFFLLFHVSDLTDLIPSRVLEMDIDRRSAPNFFGTSISVMRAEEFAARADVQYEIGLQRGAPSAALRGINAYVNVGLYTLSDLRELVLPPPGFQRGQRIPVDFTFDVGLRIDTDIGLFEFGFSNLLGFIKLK